jgi:hypothetical protein
VWDDVYLIEQNRHLDAVGGLSFLLTHDLWSGAGHAASDLYHPIPIALLWAVTRIAGHSLIALRSINVLLHAAANLLFAAWLRRRGIPARAAMWTALLLAVHPLVTEPVMWITGSHDLLATLGCLTALLLWPRSQDANPGARVFLSSMATAWAALCKEPYFVFPLLLVLAALLDDPGARRPAHIARLAGPWAALGVVLAIRHWVGVPTSSALLGASIGSQLITFATVAFHYLEHALTFTNAPTTESFRPLASWEAGLVLAAIMGVTLLLVVRLRRGVVGAACRAPKASGPSVALLGWGWFLLGLAPHTLSLPIIGMYGNRYAYFPMMGLAASLLGLGLGLRVSGRLAQLLHRTAPALLPALVGLAALFTAGEASLWRDELTLFGADLRSDPQDARALYHYGHAIVGRDGCGEALPYFESATRYEPGYGRAWHNTAGCLINLGRYRDALPAAQTAWKLQPNDAGAAYNLAVVELATGHSEQVALLLQAALHIDPQHAGARHLVEKLATPAAPPSP